MSSKKNWIILLVVAVVIIIGAFLITTNSKSLTSAVPAAENNAPAVAEAGSYQAVFLNNNQVYFGKLSDENNQFVKLTDIYYLQVNQQIQPKGQTAPANPGVNLIKLGGELHGPTDMMKINRDQVLLIEDLRADSNVVKAITNYKTNQAKAATPEAK